MLGLRVYSREVGWNGVNPASERSGGNIKGGQGQSLETKRGLFHPVLEGRIEKSSRMAVTKGTYRTEFYLEQGFRVLGVKRRLLDGSIRTKVTRKGFGALAECFVEEPLREAGVQGEIDGTGVGKCRLKPDSTVQSGEPNFHHKRVGGNPLWLCLEGHNWVEVGERKHQR